MNIKLFANTTKTSFEFLETMFECKRLKPKKIGWRISVSYINSTTQIDINYGDRDDLIYVAMYKLTNGKLIDKGSQYNGYQLWALLSLKAPKKCDELERQVAILRKNLTDDGIIKHLEYSAEMLKEYGKDILRGDFAMFPAFHKICMERIAPLRSEIYKNLTDEQRKLLP